MSGIVGIYYLDGRPVERSEIQGMLNTISHRGPDGSGIWTDGSIGLGHQMLHTTPESLHEKLPLTNRTGTLAITADARIDNRDELIPALNFNGRPRETIPDSEIILAAYEKWGEKCSERLLGDFSFAIWDKRNRKIYCARDPIGIKPFHYYFKDGKFRWSSEPKAIFEDKEIPKEPNLPLICLYLLNRFNEREETLYKDVYRLPPSHSMIIEDGRIRKDQYWDIDPNYSIRYKTDKEYAEHFLSLFKDAVRVRLRSHSPVGAFLSGGLDSSSIVCTAHLLYKEGVVPDNGFETFSLIFDKFPCDERVYIDEVVQKWNVKANYSLYEKNLASVDFEQALLYSDVDYGQNILFFAPLFKDAQQKGIRTMLNGIGGDEILAGSYDHLTDYLLEGNIGQLISQLKHDAALSPHSTISLFFNYCLRPLIPRLIKVILKQLLRTFRETGAPLWIHHAYLRKMGVDEPGTVIHPRKFSTRSQQWIYELLRYGWNITVGMERVERFNAHFGIEMRIPFFDRVLIEFCLALPEKQRWCGEWTKKVLRQATEGILPPLVKNRKDKANFIPIVDAEMMERQANKLEDLILTSALAALGIIDSKPLHRLFEDYRRGVATDHAVRNTFLAIVWLELWYRSQWQN